MPQESPRSRITICPASDSHLFRQERFKEAVHHLEHAECQVAVHGWHDLLHVLPQEVYGWLEKTNISCISPHDFCYSCLSEPQKPIMDYCWPMGGKQPLSFYSTMTVQRIKCLRANFSWVSFTDSSTELVYASSMTCHVNNDVLNDHEECKRITHLKECLEELVQFLPVLEERVRQLSEPALHKWLQAQDAWLQVNHTTATDGGGRCYGKVLYLKHHCHILGRERKNRERNTNLLHPFVC